MYRNIEGSIPKSSNNGAYGSDFHGFFSHPYGKDYIPPLKLDDLSSYHQSSVRSEKDKPFWKRWWDMAKNVGEDVKKNGIRSIPNLVEKIGGAIHKHPFDTIFIVVGIMTGLGYFGGAITAFCSALTDYIAVGAEASGMLEAEVSAIGPEEEEMASMMRTAKSSEEVSHIQRLYRARKVQKMFDSIDRSLDSVEEQYANQRKDWPGVRDMFQPRGIPRRLLNITQSFNKYAKRIVDEGVSGIKVSGLNRFAGDEGIEIGEGSVSEFPGSDYFDDDNIREELYNPNRSNWNDLSGMKPGEYRSGSALNEVDEDNRLLEPSGYTEWNDRGLLRNRGLFDLGGEENVPVYDTPMSESLSDYGIDDMNVSGFASEDDPMFSSLADGWSMPTETPITDEAIGDIENWRYDFRPEDISDEDIDDFFNNVDI